MTDDYSTLTIKRIRGAEKTKSAAGCEESEYSPLSEAKARSDLVTDDPRPALVPSVARTFPTPARASRNSCSCFFFAFGVCLPSEARAPLLRRLRRQERSGRRPAGWGVVFPVGDGASCACACVFLLLALAAPRQARRRAEPLQSDHPAKPVRLRHPHRQLNNPQPSRAAALWAFA